MGTMLIRSLLCLVFAFAAFELAKENIRRYFSKEKIQERHLFEFLKRWLVYFSLASMFVVGTSFVVEKYFTIKGAMGEIQIVKIPEQRLNLVFYSAITFALIIVSLARIQAFNNSSSMRDFVERNVFFGAFVLFWLALNDQLSPQTMTNIADIVWRFYCSELALIVLVLSLIITLITEIIVYYAFSSNKPLR